MAYRDEVDDRAFDNMQRATLGSPDRMFKKGKLFTESEYNTRATQAERLAYDESAYDILSKLYEEDRTNPEWQGKFDKLNFKQFLGAINDEYLTEKFVRSRKDDPSYYALGGKLLSDVYEGDVEQLKLSARNFYESTQEEKPSLWGKRSRSNISIKAPEAEQY